MCFVLAGQNPESASIEKAVAKPNDSSDGATVVQILAVGISLPEK